MPYALPPVVSSNAAALAGGVARASSDTGDALERIRGWVRDELEAGSPGAVPTAGGVDLERFSGVWFVLARLPSRFQDDATLATSEYSRPVDGAVRVTHTAWRGTKVDSSIAGWARPVPGSRNDRLRVRYDGALGLLPIPDQGNLWVLDVADNYSMALVGTSDRRSLWLYSHDMYGFDTDQGRAMVARARRLGFDTDRLLVADWDTRRLRD